MSPSTQQQGTDAGEKPEPAKFLEASPRLRNARLKGLDDVGTIRQYLEYEAQHANRDAIMTRLKERMRRVR